MLSILKKSTSNVDNLTLSVVAFLFSKITWLDEEAKQILTTLEKQFSRDESSGIFWTSKWNSVDACLFRKADDD